MLNEICDLDETHREYSSVLWLQSEKTPAASPKPVLGSLQLTENSKIVGANNDSTVPDNSRGSVRSHSSEVKDDSSINSFLTLESHNPLTPSVAIKQNYQLTRFRS